MLYDAYGSRLVVQRHRPEPNTATEARVREQLQSIDSLLDIKWFPRAVFNSKHKDFEGRYALVCKWPQGDDRWELYQRGEIELPYDRLGWFCTDMQDAESVPVALDSIENKVLELLANCDATRQPHLARMKQVVVKNSNLRRSRKQEILDRTEDLVGSLHYMSGHVEDVTLQRIMKEMVSEHND